MSKKLKRAIRGIFKKQPPIKAFVLAGAAAAAYSVGLDGETTVRVMHDGLSFALSNMPLHDPLSAANAYFTGGMNYFGTLIAGATYEIKSLGGDLVGSVVENVASIKTSISSLGTQAADFFRRRSADIATFKDCVTDKPGDCIAPFVTWMPNTTKEVLLTLSNGIVAAIALHDKWAKAKEIYIGAMRMLGLKAKELAPEVTGVCPEVMNNITVNITVAGQSAADAAVQALNEAIRENDTTIVRDPVALRALLDNAIAADSAAAEAMLREQEAAREAELEAQKRAFREDAVKRFSQAREPRIDSQIEIDPTSLLSPFSDKASAGFQKELLNRVSAAALSHKARPNEELRFALREYGTWLRDKDAEHEIEQQESPSVESRAEM